MGETKWRTGEDGTLECIDVETGHVIEVEKKKEFDRKGTRYVRGGPGRGRRSRDGSDTHHWVMIGKNKMWVPKGTNPDDQAKVVWPFSQSLCDTIAELISEGKTLSQICTIEGFPPAGVINKWQMAHPETKAQFKEARAMRAQVFHDLTIETAEHSEPETAASDKLLVDTYKWAAEVGDRETYGKQQKITGDPNAPIGFIIDTGIRRPSDVQSSESGGDLKPAGAIALSAGEEKEVIGEVRDDSGSDEDQTPKADVNE